MVLITPEQMAAYRASARQRRQQKTDRLQMRYQRGRAIAQQAATLLKQDFQVEKVALFGSMVSGDRIHERSDVDLAVWGLNPQDLYKAVGQLLALAPDIPIDVVPIEEHDLASYGQRKNTWGIADLSRHQNLHNLSNRLALHQEPLCQLQQLLHSLSCQGVEPLSNGMLVVLSKVKPLR
jgi:predicted nucleotidyltransferase